MGRGRRLAWPALGVAALVGAVLLLRSSSGVQDHPVGAPLEFFAADGVTGPPTPDPPQAPAYLRATRGAGHVVLDWQPGAGDGAGYEVRFAPAGQPGTSRLVGGTSVDLHGLDDGDQYRAEVRAVDSIGRRSPPAELDIRTDPNADEAVRAELTGFYDDFDNSGTLARRQWRVPLHTAEDACLRRGAGVEEGYLLLLPNCPQVRLRAAPPLVLEPPDANGVRGRVVLALDGPAPPQPGAPPATAALTLIPATVSGLPSTAALQLQSGTAALDPLLPPGSLALRWAPDGPALIVGPSQGSPNAPAVEHLAPLPPSTPGTPHRWELTIGAHDVTVSRDGAPVLRTQVQVAWSQATVLLTTSPEDRIGRLRLDMFGFSGPPSSPRLVRVFDVAGRTAISTEVLASADGLRVLGYLPALDPGATAGPPVTARLGGAVAELRSALPGEPAVPAGVPRPVVADLPVAAMDNRARAGMLVIEGGQLQQGQLEVSIAPRQAAQSQATELPRLDAVDLPAPPTSVVGVTDSSGRPVNVATGVLPRERVTVEAHLDGVAAEADAGEVGGVAGLAVELDGAPLLTVPTAAEGPGVGGAYRFGLDVSAYPAGPHRMTVRAVATQGGVDSTTSSTIRFG